MENGVNSVEDIDALLDSEFNITEDDNVDLDTTQTDEDNQDDVSDDASTNADDGAETDDNSQGNDEGSNDGTTNQNADDTDNKGKPNADDKREYSFAQLRKENADLKARVKEVTDNEEILKNIAAQYGYSDVKEFAKAYDDARIAQEAKQKGYDPVLYKQLQDSNRRIAELEKQNGQSKLMERAGNFKNAVEKAIVDYNLGEDGRNEIFSKLEAEGYTVDTILSLPNPEIVIKGVLSDKIAEISKQKQIEKLENLDNIADERHSDGSSTKSFNIDDYIDEDLKEYKANNFYE